MRIRLFSLLAFGALCAASVALPARSVQARQLCYCRVTNPSSLTEADERKFCQGEVIVAGAVPFGLTAGSDCTQLCRSAGNEYAGLSVDNPAERSYDAALGEKTQCLFSKEPHGPSDLEVITGWSEKENNCRAPINAIAGNGNPKGQNPSACSYCFCKYRADVKPGSCAGKTVYMRATGAPSECPRFCQNMGMDEAGNAVKSYNDLCDYKSAEGCKTPFNPLGACGELLAGIAKNAEASSFQANRGTALGQVLLLGDLSVPGAIALLIKKILSVVGAIALVFFLWGGIKYMTAAGDDKKVAEARGMITTTVSGLIAIFLSYALLSFLINVLT